MVLGAGFFSTEKAKSVIHTGVETATSSAELAGDVIGHGWKYNTTAASSGHSYYFNDSAKGNHSVDTTNLTVVEFQVELTAGHERLDMNKVVISYSDNDTYVAELTRVANIGTNNVSLGNLSLASWSYSLATDEMGESSMLDPNEKITVIVALPEYGVTVTKEFMIDFKPALGGTITLSKTAPGAIDKTMLLYE